MSGWMHDEKILSPPLKSKALAKRLQNTCTIQDDRDTHFRTRMQEAGTSRQTYFYIWYRRSPDNDTYVLTLLLTTFAPMHSGD